MKVLLDQSGYAIDNLGDTAMLRVALERLGSSEAVSDVLVLNSDPEALEGLAPTARSIDLREDLEDPESLKARVRARLSTKFRPGMPLEGVPGSLTPRTAIRIREALEESDAVCSAGGGFLCDSFKPHAFSVLGLLHAGQRKGRPTAMFGQGIGPVTSPGLKHRMKKLLPKLVGLNVRVPSDPSLMSLSNIEMTGDDALALAVEGAGVEGGDAGSGTIGVNFRFARYNGHSKHELIELGSRLVEHHRASGRPLQSLPIALRGDEDLNSIRTALFGSARRYDTPLGDPVTDVDSLIRACRRCSVIVTMSYHAAVFGLASGVPVIGLSESSYYDEKFVGLQRIYGSAMMRVVRPKDVLRDGVSDMLQRAEEVPESVRRSCIDISVDLAEKSASFYEEVLERMAS